MSGHYSDLSDVDDLNDWLEEFNEDRPGTLTKYQEENPGEELEGDETDASPIGAGRGILRKSFNLGKHTKNALPKSADLLQLRYKFPKEQLGYFLIFNQQKFSDNHSHGMKERIGSDVDVKRLTDAMMSIGFTVRVYDNYTTKEVSEKIEKYAMNEEMGKCNSFGLAFLSHGSENGDLATFDGMTNVKKIIEKVKGSTLLAGKPKLFIFQACRGGTYMDAQKVTQVAVRADDRPLTWPKEADIICLFATVEGYFSYRNPVDGSWLVLNLCHQINQWLENYEKNKTELEFHHLLIRVNAALAQMASRTNDPRTSGKKQVSVIQSQLTKELYFTDYKPN